VRARGLIIALAVTLATPSVALAGDKRAAAAHFKEGRALYDAGRWDEALAAFEAGYEAFPLKGFLVNIGQCQRKLDRLEDAAASYQKFLDGAPDERLRGEVTEALSELKVELDRRAAVQAEAEQRRKQADEQQRKALLDSIAREQSASSPAVQHLNATPENEVRTEAPRKKSRVWLWSLLGVVAAGAVAGGVAAAVIYTQPSTHAGSLGLIDGRR
jgi:tetratricopeptide (TPR) repeat protein